MSLQKTVSKILNKEVSLEDAKNFANEQYGLLITYYREQIKEHRVYVLEVDDCEFKFYDIEDWGLYQEKHDKLHQDAEEFISKCELIGEVYSLQGFQNAYNLGDIDIANSYIFITNNY